MNGNYILDTNIILLLLKNEKFGLFFEEAYQKENLNNFYYTHISLGELDSISKQNHWGSTKTEQLNTILRGFSLVELVNINVIEAYGTLDAYSQGKLQDSPLPEGITSRNMGKNDLWIAAAAMTLQATLITTDKDFDHLDPAFIQVNYIDIHAFQ